MCPLRTCPRPTLVKGCRDRARLRTGCEGGWEAPGQPSEEAQLRPGCRSGPWVILKLSEGQGVCRTQALGPKDQALSGDVSVEGRRKG